jgi:EAL domain-containing protein (putative c-di-GMP-specific phosphodiesterase class I)
MEALLRLPGYLGGAGGVCDRAGRRDRLLPELGSWVCARLAQLRRWRDAGVEEVRICINTCAKELQDAGYLWQLEAALVESGLSPADVEIELTERDAIELERNGSNIIEQLRARGFTVSLDDFGTGYSSLSYLRALPVSTIKLDKSFLRGVPGTTTPTPWSSW